LDLDGLFRNSELEADVLVCHTGANEPRQVDFGSRKRARLLWRGDFRTTQTATFGASRNVANGHRIDGRWQIIGLGILRM
jgi:hypothetical protein